MTRREYQRSALKAMNIKRLFALLFERQAGKSTILAEMALKKMMKKINATCIYASASLLLGREIILKQTQAVDISARELIKKEADLLNGCAERFGTDAKEMGMIFETADAGKGKVVKDLSPDDFAELFESQRLEFRVYHDRTRYSRTQVIAPNVATARGWAGTVFLDEIAFIRDFSELWIAIEPIISTNPEFQLIMATTPPQDDTHATFELLSPPAGMEFKANAAGNWYESEAGIPVLRADAFDTFAAGKKIYDLKTGKPITPMESFARAIHKDGWRLNHGLQWIIGGTSACNLILLKTAQERGVGACKCFVIDSDQDFADALAWIDAHIIPNQNTGIGFDVATTTAETSNPSVFSIVQGSAIDAVVRAFVIWKTRDPDIARERIEALVTLIERHCGRARAMAVDATNEKYFAEDLRRDYRARMPVMLMVASEGVEKPGLEKPTNWKEYLGDQYVAQLEDNRLTLPSETYVRIDHRMVKKDRGKYVCKPSPDGMHGDTFDSGKLGLHALIEKPSGISTVDGIAHGANQSEESYTFIPHTL